LITISAALIVKNEENFLADCLASIKLLVDEIVLVDTGSTDNTVAIAEKYGATIYHFPWNGRFDDARNYGLDHCQSDWILYIDADERIRPCDVAVVKEELANPQLLASRLFLSQSIGVNLVREWRLFRNHPKLRFQGLIHETIVPALDGMLVLKKGITGLSSLVIDHLGYEGDLTHKHHRNLPLLKAAINENPQRVYLWAELGRAQFELGQEIEAKVTWLKAIELTHDVTDPGEEYAMAYIMLINMLLGRNESATVFIKEALAFFPKHRVINLCAAKQLMADKQFLKAIELFLAVVDWEAATEEGVTALNAKQIYSISCEHLGYCYFSMAKFKASVDWYDKAIEADSERIDLKLKAAMARKQLV